MSTSLILQTMDSAATFILLTRGMITPLPSNRRIIARLSNGPSSDPCEATTAANASADGPLAVADAAAPDEAAAAYPMTPASARAASRFTRNVMINFMCPSMVLLLFEQLQLRVADEYRGCRRHRDRPVDAKDGDLD